MGRLDEERHEPTMERAHDELRGRSQPRQNCGQRRIFNVKVLREIICYIGPKKGGWTESAERTFVKQAKIRKNVRYMHGRRMKENCSSRNAANSAINILSYYIVGMVTGLVQV